MLLWVHQQGNLCVCVNRNVCENVRRGGQGIEKKKERRKVFPTVHLFTGFPECSSRDATYGIWGLQW